jgi:uncharacterized membrane protein
MSECTNQSPSQQTASGVAKIVERNIKALIKVRSKVEKKKTRSDRIADWVVKIAGNMMFAYLHAIWFVLWIADSILRGQDAFDPFPFSLLTTIVSLEAIFLTLFVLVSQNRQSKQDEQRANLNLQIDLLAEHEITKLLCLVDQIAEKLGVQAVECDPEFSDLEHDVTPGELIKELNRQEKKADAALLNKSVTS